MNVKWYPPFDQYFGKKSEVPLDGPVSLKSILIQIREKEEAMEPYVRFSPEDRQPHGLMVWRRGEVLGLDDMVQPEDELEMIIMVAGG